MFLPLMIHQKMKFASFSQALLITSEEIEPASFLLRTPPGTPDMTEVNAVNAPEAFEALTLLAICLNLLASLLELL